MRYIDSQGRQFKSRRPDGWPIDEKAPDGFTVNGFRKVKSNKTFKFVGTNWQSDFNPGSMVYVSLSCGWATSVIAVLVDTDKWNPDNINDNWREFVAHFSPSSTNERQVAIGEERQWNPQ